MDYSSNNKRIAQNTIMLYIRMFLMMAVSLYTSRVILNLLGIEDYGIFNVVGGVVAMVGFLQSSLSGAGARFIAYSLGKGDQGELTKVFSTVKLIHYLLAILIVILGESIGLWFVCNKLVIPANRMMAAIWVYQSSVIITVIAVVSTPYNSLIIANEKMSAFAYISIVEALLKLGIAFLLMYIPYDKLIVYSVLLMCIQLLIRIIYNVYCRNHFPESRTKLIFDRQKLKEISSYAAWTINGNLAIVGYTQGINILLNMFFGPVVNAARGIAVQVQSAIMVFVNNFQTAVNPQIIKSYANHELNYMHNLVVKSSTWGFYLVLMIAFPLAVCINPILKLWLGVVPDHTSTFVIIMLIAGLLEPMKVSLLHAIHATGNIKKFQIYEGTSLLMIVPIAYIILKLFKVSPELVMCVYLIVEVFTQFLRIKIVLPQISMSYSDYFERVLKRGLYILPFVVIPFLILPIVPDSVKIYKIFIYLAFAFVYIVTIILLIGFNRQEKSILYKIVKSKIFR